ncbi:MAG: SDR family oxidoreductase, partial [Myxococcota bacterium]
FVTGRREAPLQALAQQHGDRIAFMIGDVSQSKAAEKIVAACVQRFGRLDILVNNAGIAPFMPLAEMDDETIDAVLATNLAGPLRMARAALEPLARTRGQVISVSSTVTKAVMPGAVVYGASKAGLDYMTKVLAVEAASKGIRVNAIAPGATETDLLKQAMPSEAIDQLSEQTPLGRLGTPNDIAKVLTLLASDDAGWVTGQVLAASGGFML